MGHALTGACLAGGRALRWHGYQTRRAGPLKQDRPLSPLQLRASILSNCTCGWCTCCVLVLGQDKVQDAPRTGYCIASPQSRISIGAAGELSASSLSHPSILHGSLSRPKSLPNNINTKANCRNPQPATQRNATSPYLSLSPIPPIVIQRMISHCLASMTKVSFVHLRAVGRVLSHIRSRPRPPMFGPSYQGMANSVSVVALICPCSILCSLRAHGLSTVAPRPPSSIDPPLQILPP
ncbi:hypothetical protein V8C34DRAFT_58343 [Trichoderma compactum]